MDIGKFFAEIIMKYNKEMKGIKGIWLINDELKIVAKYHGFTNFPLDELLRIIDKMSKIYRKEMEEVVLTLGGYSIYCRKMKNIFFISSFLYKTNLGFLRLMAQNIEEQLISSTE